MDFVVPSAGSPFSYPEVTENANHFVWSDDRPKPENETIIVTAHGLRRLLRFVSDAQRVCAWAAYRDHPRMAELYASEATQEKCAKLFRESATIFCEGSLVMSRLFVTRDGKVIAHKDDEVDAAGIPPWERDAK